VKLRRWLALLLLTIGARAEPLSAANVEAWRVRVRAEWEKHRNAISFDVGAERARAAGK